MIRRWEFKWSFSIWAAYILVSVMPFFASACEESLRSFPVRVLQERGIDPAKISVKFFSESLNQFEFRVRYEGAVVGVFEMTRLEDEPGFLFASTQVTVSDSFEGRGLGSYMYLCAARWLSENGAELRSDFSPSDQAVAVWRRFKLLGLAREKDGYFYMDQDRISHAAKEIYPGFVAAIENTAYFQSLKPRR
jgi:GNAT superfamily N-acetyltransferase